MIIKKIVIEGAKGDVEIVSKLCSNGAFVMVRDVCIAAFDRHEDRDKRFTKVREVAGAIYGMDRRGRPAATNSMLHDVMNEVDRIADC